MDAFDDAFGESPAISVKTERNGNGILDDDESDPAAEFLAREQSNLAGLEDEIPATDGLGGGVSNGNDTTAEDVTNGHAIEDDFTIIDNNGEDFMAARPASPVSTSPLQTFSIPREEPEKIRIWREEQKTRLEVKDRDEEESKDKLREAAKKELEDWYKNYEEQISKTKNSNRSAEQEGAAADASPVDDGKDWERIANLCDFNPKSSKQQKDISRMRSLILQLKQNPPTSRRQSSAGSSNAS